MRTIQSKKELCPACMEVHNVDTVIDDEINIYRGIEVHYEAEFQYCCVCDEYFVTEKQLAKNYEAMKKAYNSVIAK